MLRLIAANVSDHEIVFAADDAARRFGIVGRSADHDAGLRQRRTPGDVAFRMIVDPEGFYLASVRHTNQ